MRYTPTHEWIKQDDETATIGITDYAQNELGDVVYVELPRIGHTVKAGDEIVVLESTKAAVDLYSPLSGTIVEINPTLKEAPETINHAPENEGWIFKIKLTNQDEFKNLLTFEHYHDQLKI